jgi:SNF2 family DNA or RNA helicase
MTQINEMLWVPKPEAPQIVAMCAQPAIRFTRDQCLDLPDTMYQTFEVPLTEEQRMFYEKMRKESLMETESGTVTAKNSAILLNKLLQISAGAVKNNDGNVIEIGCKDRIDQLMEIFHETPQKKLVIFATYRATIEMLMRELTKKGVHAACIHGDVAQNLRAAHIENFQRGSLQVLVLQPQSSAHGITLTASSTIVWFSLIPSNELFQQGNARIVRAGQTRKTMIYMFVSTKAERHIAKILETKGDMSNEVQRLFVEQDL